MDMFKHFRKCFLCGQGGSELKKVPQYGIYGKINKYYAYHPACLKLVLCDPERYNHKKVDMALHIVNLIKDCEKEKEEILTAKKERQERIKKAKELCKDF
jgi:hypothetical protein